MDVQLQTMLLKTLLKVNNIITYLVTMPAIRIECKGIFSSKKKTHYTKIA